MANKEIDSPIEVRRDLAIELRVRPENSKVSARREFLKFYQLIQRGSEHYIVDSEGNPPVFETPKCDFQFVILRDEVNQNRLKLIISKGPHDTIANHAKHAAAAGDIFTEQDLHGNCKLVKFNDQSGSYYIPNTDPQISQKQLSARAAMKAIGLPMDKFQPFALPSALVFSTTLRDMKRQKEVTDNTVEAKRETLSI